jgi:hypothetical protein
MRHSSEVATLWVKSLFKSRRSTHFSKHFITSIKRGRAGIIAAFREAADPRYPVLESGLIITKMTASGMQPWKSMSRWAKRTLPFHISLLNGADEEVRTFSGVMLGTMQDRDAVPHSLRRWPIRT